MNEKETIKRLKEKFNQFEAFWEGKEWWGAIKSLSYLYNCIDTQINSIQIRKDWMDKLVKPTFTKEICDNVENGYLKMYRQITKILSVGDRFNDDEFLLLMTYHTTLSLVLEYLNLNGVKCPIVDLKGVEREIIEFGKLKKNRNDFNSSISQMRKNGIPVNIIWHQL